MTGAGGGPTPDGSIIPCGLVRRDARCDPTATAFGSLWLSSHPGTSSMGQLLALSLLTTLAAAVLFQPVLMGKPRETSD